MKGEIITREEMLAIPAYEISDLSQIPSEPLVSIIVITYNHEAYVEETIQGILAQQCDFPIELIIGEDKSKDRTLEICLDYQKKYPTLIRVVTWHENVGANANFLRVWGRARGKYVAICEGDDYWIDPDKLTKQAALMEQSPSTMLCGAKVCILDNFKASSCGEVFGPPQMKEHFGFEDVIEEYLFHTSTFLLRKSEFKIPACARSVHCVDEVLMAAAARQGNLRCLPDTVSVYRLHTGGIFSRLNSWGRYEKDIEWLEAISQFADGGYSRMARKKADLLTYWYCCELSSTGQLTPARLLAWKTIRRLALHAPKRALMLIFHVCLPRTFRLVADAWIRHKHRCDTA